MKQEEFRCVGKSRRRVDGRSKATGKTIYADDVMLPRMLHCKLLRSSVAHANLIKVDIRRAEK